MEIHDLKYLGLTFFMVAGPLWAAVPDGYVVRVDSAVVYLDWGKSSGIQAKNEFAVYRQGPTLKHPVTGEVLGQTEESVGQGIVETVQDKFSIGRVLEHRLEWKTGDRTRLTATAPAPAVQSGAESGTAAPKPIWVSTPITGEPRGLAVGDLSGKGTPSIVIALKDRLEVYGWQAGRLEKMATYADRHTANWISVDAADLDHVGHAKIFATWYLDGVYRARTVILELSSGTLKEVGRVEGFVRAIPRADGSMHVFIQDFSLSRELRVHPPRELIADNGKWKSGPTIDFPRRVSDSQLFGFALGDFDGDKIEDWAILQNGERLRVQLKDKTWVSDQLYGGTKMDVQYNNAVDSVATLFPRMAAIKNSAGQNMLLVPRNDSATGLRFTRLKLFHSGALIALVWNGLEMQPVWRIPSPSYIADFGVGSVSDAQHLEAWILSDAPGNKAILSGFTLP